jgi:hypothetical protein
MILRTGCGSDISEWLQNVVLTIPIRKVTENTVIRERILKHVRFCTYPKPELIQQLMNDLRK